MEIVFLRKFSKDLDKIKQPKDKQSILSTIDLIRNTKNFEDITGIKKLVGFKDAYRIRSGDFRIGFFLSGNVIQMARVVHRKDIYRVFP